MISVFYQFKVVTEIILLPDTGRQIEERKICGGDWPNHGSSSSAA